MVDYTNEYSKFPQELLTIRKYTDANNAIAEHINTIKNLQSNGKYDEAREYIYQYKEELSNYALTSEDINRLEEEIRNVEIMCLGQNKQVYYEDYKPVTALVGNVWIGNR